MALQSKHTSITLPIRLMYGQSEWPSMQVAIPLQLHYDVSAPVIRKKILSPWMNHALSKIKLIMCAYGQQETPRLQQENFELVLLLVRINQSLYGKKHLTTELKIMAGQHMVHVRNPTQITTQDLDIILMGSLMTVHSSMQVSQ